MYLQEWAKEARHRAQGSNRSPTSVRCSTRATTTSPSTAGPSTPTRTTCSSIHTCSGAAGHGGRAVPSDNYFCDKEYDELYAQQLAEYDPAKRAGIVKQMESRLYDRET